MVDMVVAGEGQQNLRRAGAFQDMEGEPVGRQPHGGGPVLQLDQPVHMDRTAVIPGERVEADPGLLEDIDAGQPRMGLASSRVIASDWIGSVSGPPSDDRSTATMMMGAVVA